MMAYLFIFSYPLIHADRLYRDDIWRSFHGEMGWVSNGRPLSSLVMAILNGGPRLADLAPLPLWLGLAALAYAILLWRRRLKAFDTGYAWVAMLILVVQPFFLQKISYRFDALPMALALASAVIGIACALDPREGKHWQARFRWAAGGTGVLAALLFYQPAANAYFVLLAFHAVLSVAQTGRPQWSRHLGALLIGFIALIIVALGMPLTLSYAYGNAQRQQAIFADYVSTRLIDDLSTQPEAAPLVIDGALPYTRTTRNAIAVHPLIGELISPYLDGFYWWGYQDLYRRGLPAAFDFNDDLALRRRFEARCQSLSPLIRRAWYTLYHFEGTYVVALSDDCHRAMTATELPIDN